jgi:hypothetical protein
MFPPMVVMLGAGSLSPHAIPPAPDGAVRSASELQGAPSITPAFVPPWRMAEQGPPDIRPDVYPAGLAVYPLKGSFDPVTVEYVSPSAIETATEELGGCMRKWAWVKLDRLAKHSGKSAELGSAMHAQHERYLEHGTPYDLTTRAGELALATLHLLPAPGIAQVEQEFRVEVPGLGWLGGKLDANWTEPPAESGARGAPGRRQIVLDHKSTGDIKYAKLTRGDLLGHPQAPIYASFWWTTGRREVRIKNSREWRAWDPGFVPNEIELRWNYVTTKGKPKAVPSWHVVEPEEVWKSFAQYVAPGAKRLLEVVQEANEVRASGRPFGAMDLPANPSACGAFGGCQFRDICGITPLQGVRAMTDQSLAFLNRMGLAPAPGGQPAGLPTAPVAQPAPAAQAAPAAPVAPAWAPPAAASPAASTAPGYGAQINPPESAPAVQAQAAQVAAQVAAEQAAASPHVEATKTKGPGRPKKDKGAEDAPNGTAIVEALSGRVSVGLSLHDQALVAVLPECVRLLGAHFMGANPVPPASALELARAVVAPLAAPETK